MPFKRLSSVFAAVVFGLVISKAPAQILSSGIPLQVKQVTLFTNQAQVTASATAHIQAGTHVLRFTALGNSIVPNTILVRAKGSFTLVSINQDLNYLRQSAKVAMVKALKDSIAQLERAKRQAAAQYDVLTKETTFLQANFAVKGQGNLSLAELQKASEYFSQRFAEINNKQMAVSSRLDEINNRMAQLNDQLRQYETGSKLPEPELEVTVKAAQATKADFEFQYLVNNAGWMPVYDIRVSENSNKMLLQLKANAYQNTGLDWDKVKINFSTANPTFTGERPMLYTQYIDFIQPVVPGRRKAFSANTKMAGEAPAMMMQMDAEMLPNAVSMEEYVSVADRGLETEYAVEMPLSMPNSVNRREIELKNFELPITFRHVAVPKLSSQVYFLAVTHGWEKADILPGKAQIYYDGAYVGSTFVNPNQSTDTIQISLGVDPKITIKRERNLYQEKNFFGNRKSDTYTFTITMKNNRKTPVDLHLEDQYPVSQNESLKVELKDISGARREDAEGKLIWQVNIKPGEQQVRQFKYTITYPNDKKLPPIY